MTAAPSPCGRTCHNGGHIRYTLKTPYRDGTMHVIFEPMDFMARLAAWYQSPGAASVNQKLLQNGLKTAASGTSLSSAA